MRLIIRTVIYLNASLINSVFGSTVTDISAGKASREHFQIEAQWIGPTQWMLGVDNGYEAFNGSIAKGIDIFSSSIKTIQYVPVKIKLDSNPANWTLVQIFRRELIYDPVGVGTFPGSAWDMSVPSSPRRLNLCIAEFDDAEDSLPSPNFHWDPNSSQHGKFEFLFILNSDYDGNGETYSNINILRDDPDLLYVWWPRLNPGHAFFESGAASLFIYPIIQLGGKQFGTRVELDWFTPGTVPRFIGVFWSEISPADSLITILDGAETHYSHLGITYETLQYYKVKSFDSTFLEVLSSHEITSEILPRAPVISVLPTANSNSVGIKPKIEIVSLLPLDPQSFNDTSFWVYGTMTGPMIGSLMFTDGNKKVTFEPDSNFFHGELISVSLSRAIRLEIGDSISNGYTWSFRTKTKLGSLYLEKTDELSVRLAGELLVRPNSINTADFNNDGWSDIAVVCGATDDLRIFLNDGTGQFDSISSASPFTRKGEIYQNISGDFNLDGSIDIATGTLIDDSVKIAFGTGDGRFENPINLFSGISVQQLALLDANSDGLHDILTANVADGNLVLLLNSGGTSFSPVQYLNRYNGAIPASSCATSELNGDGLIDIVYGTDGYFGEVIPMLGDGFGGFSPSLTSSSGGQSIMLDAGDVNLDGFADLVSVNYRSHSVGIIFGTGLGSFIFSSGKFAGRYPQTVHLGDIDGDGDLDIVSTSFSNKQIITFENDGHGQFERAAVYLTAGGVIGTAFHDPDNDGDLDMIGIDQQNDLILLYENNCCSNRRGDFNGDGAVADVMDLTFLVNYIFRGSGDFGSCLSAIDVNNDGKLSPNILDLTFLVDFIFRGGPLPAMCQ